MMTRGGACRAPFVRVYGRDFPARLWAAGFAVNERRYASELPEGEATRYGLSESDIIYNCRKAAP